MKNAALLLISICLLSLTAFAQGGTQTIRGQIIDEVSKSPLPGVIVTVTTTNPVKGASTDLDGNFKITDVPLGRHTLEVKFLGYEPRTMENIIVTAGKEIVLEISLTEKVIQKDEVVITYDRKDDKTLTNNEMATVSSRSFNVEETSKYAGSLGDPSRMAANFAGVAAGNDSRNDIVVRGNSPTGMLWQMEGLDIPNPNHFGALNSTGGPVSMLNNNNLAKSDFLTSAFPAQYGNANAGVFDLNLRNGNSEKYEFLGQIGFNGFEGGAEGPFSKKSKASFLVNYRYSTLGVFQKLGINFGTGSATPLYQDVNYKIFLPIGSRSKITLFGIAGNSSVNFLGNEVDTTKTDLYGSENTNTRVKYSTNIHGMAFEHNFGTKTFMKISLGYVHTFEQFRGDSISTVTRQEFPSGEAKFITTRYLSSGILTHKFSSKSSASIGFNEDLIDFNIFNKTITEGTIDRIRVDQKDHMSLTQAFVQWKYRFTDKFSLITGVHGQYLDFNQTSSVEPRAGLRYVLGHGISLNAGYGLHSQQQSIYSYFVQTPTANGIAYTNKNLEFSKSQHFVLGMDWNITEHMRIKTEVYYQSLFNIPVEMRATSFSVLNSGASFAPENTDSLVNKGTGQNYGLEITVERFFHKGYYFLVTGSFFDSKYKGSDGIERNTAFNTKYVVNALAGKEFTLGKKGWVLNANFRLTSTGGRYLTPIDYAASSLAGDAVYEEELAYSERQASYFRADVKLGIRKEYKRSTMEFAIDLQNVSNHKNVFQQSYNPRTNKLVTQYQQGFFPVPMFKVTF